MARCRSTSWASRSSARPVESCCKNAKAGESSWPKDERPDIDFYLPRFTQDGRHLVRPVVDWSGELDRRLIDGEMQAIVRKAIDQLGPVAKAILLSDLDGYSNREIGEALSLSVQAVKARLHRARLYLRGKLAVELGSSPG
jgi:RNA polymerase sigma-70 factor, ECF subfamily